MSAKEERRKHITDAARTLFTEFGYKPVSMDQIAQKAGVAKGTLYLYYKDKDDLFSQLTRETLTDIKDFIESIEAKHLTIFEEIHTVVYNLLMMRTRQKFIYRISQEAEEFKTPSAIALMRTLEGRISEYVEQKLREGMETGLIKPCDTRVLTFVVLKVYLALAFEWEETHAPLDEKQIAESVSLFLKDGLLVTGAQTT